MKVCTRCGETKPLDDFAPEKRVKDGKSARCRECIREVWNENRDKNSAAQKAYRDRNPEKMRDKARAYYAANKHKQKETRKAYRDQRREWMKDYLVAYYAENTHKKWEGKYRNRARKYGLEPVVESFTKDELIARYGDACFHCGGPFEQLDHWPLAVVRGGPHVLENCRPSCAECNRISWRDEATQLINDLADITENE